MLLVLYGLAFAFAIALFGLQSVVGFVAGTAIHGAFLKQRISVRGLGLAGAGIMLSLAGVWPFGRMGFYLGALVYGWYYWDGTENTGTRNSPWLRTGFVWRWFGRWYGHRVRIPRPADVMPWETGRTALYVAHPHGCLALGFVLTFIGPDYATRLPILVGAHWMFFALPVVREVMLALGCVNARRDVLRNLLTAGHSVAILPEGTRGFAPRITAHLPARTGYVGVARALQIPLVVIETPDEHETYWLWEPRILDSVRTSSLKACGYPFFTFLWPRFPRKALHTYCASVRQYKDDTLDRFFKRISDTREALGTYAEAERARSVLAESRSNAHAYRS